MKHADFDAIPEETAGTGGGEADEKPRKPNGRAGHKAHMPLVRLEAGKLDEHATAAETILLNADAPFYQRSGQLVRPVTQEVDAAKGHKTRIAAFAPITDIVVVDWLSRSSVWERFDGRKKDFVACDPPTKAAAVMLSRRGEWTFRIAAGVITTPTMRPDGSLLTQPGYDPQTRLILTNPPDMPPIPENPSRDEAMAALHTLAGLLRDFPFADDDEESGESRSVALSGLMTPVLRGAFATAPMHVMSAPTPGTGKSYLVDVCAAIATGQRAAAIAVAKTQHGDMDEAETEKRLGAALMAGMPIVMLDNCNGELRGDALCQAIERPSVAMRVLGLSELRTIENRASFFATGNNLRLSGDIVRRCITCTLDARLERPELRRFRGDPMADILENRSRYIAAILTIARAYVTAGKPEQPAPLASFEDWSALVRGALIWLDEADPVATMDKARANDPELEMLRNVLTAWRATFGGDFRSTGDAIAQSDHTDLAPALKAVAGRKDGTMSARTLGRWLSGKEGRVIENLRLASMYDSHKKVKLWGVQCMDE